MGRMYTQGQNAEGRGKWRKEKVHLKVQNLVCPKQELWESQNISRRSRISKFIQGQLVGKNKQEVWFGVPGKLVTLERDLQLRTRKRKQACRHAHVHRPANRCSKKKKEATLLQTVSTKKPVKNKTGNANKTNQCPFFHLASARVVYGSEGEGTSKALRAHLSFSVLSFRI